MSVTASNFPRRSGFASGPLMGILTVWPLLYGAFFFFSVLFSAATHSPPFIVSLMAGGGFGLFMAVHVFTVFSALGLTAFYIVHAARNRVMSTDEKIMWVALMVLFTAFVTPVYWWKRVR